MNRNAWRIVTSTALVLCSTLGLGCVPWKLREPPPVPDSIRFCHALPQPCKNRVYLFFVHGFDPLDLGKLAGLRDEVIGLGFIKAYAGYPHHLRHFEKEMVRLHQEDPLNRFVLIGHQHGAQTALKLGASAQAAGILVDAVVCLDAAGDPIPEQTVPATTILHIDSGKHDPAEGVAGGEHYVIESSKTGMAVHPRTIDLVVGLLVRIGEQVPIIRTQAGQPSAPGVHAKVPAPPADEWNFLQGDNSPIPLGVPPMREAAQMEPATMKGP